MHFESMEVRQLFATGPVSVDDNGVMTVKGTNANDSITIDRFLDMYAVSVNGTYQSPQAAEIKRIVVLGRKGDDTITLETSGTEPIVTVKVRIEGGSGDDSILAGNKADNIFGGTGKDTILGFGGNDTIRGQGGKDSLEGGAGNDVLRGGLGSDSIEAAEAFRAGNDKLFGQAGADTLYVQPDDTARGGSGTDDLIDVPASL